MRSIQNKLARKSKPIKQIKHIKIFDMKTDGTSFMYDMNGRWGEGAWIVGKIQKNRFSGKLNRFRSHRKAYDSFNKGH